MVTWKLQPKTKPYLHKTIPIGKTLFTENKSNHYEKQQQKIHKKYLDTVSIYTQYLLVSLVKLPIKCPTPKYLKILNSDIMVMKTINTR